MTPELQKIIALLFLHHKPRSGIDWSVDTIAELLNMKTEKCREEVKCGIFKKLIRLDEDGLTLTTKGIAWML